MPTDILEIARMGLEQMRRHPRNFYDWRVRREIYKLLNANSKSLPDCRHQSLAIQAAEHVFPLYKFLHQLRRAGAGHDANRTRRLGRQFLQY